jgi:hypothetical protein
MNTYQVLQWWFRPLCIGFGEGFFHSGPAGDLYAVSAIIDIEHTFFDIEAATLGIQSVYVCVFASSLNSVFYMSTTLLHETFRMTVLHSLRNISHQHNFATYCMPICIR